jgi:uncharacterized protein (TIGR03000 family)
MYSLLLMTAMAGSPDASGFGWRNGGCYGCAGFAGCGGCVGFAGHAGCFGCGGFAAHHGCNGGGLFSRWHARKAGRGGCHGAFHGGCLGAGVGCWGGCVGAGVGCWGGCVGAGVGCFGAGVGCLGAGCVGAGFGVGCIGGTGCWGWGPAVGAPWIDAVPVPPVMTAPAVPIAPPPAGTGEEGKKDESALAPARLTVELPVAARLFVDGSPVAGSGSSRRFHTPDLPAGQAFFYDLRAEVEVNGRVETEERRVVVRAGEVVTASFDRLFAATATAAEYAAK